MSGPSCQPGTAVGNPSPVELTERKVMVAAVILVTRVVPIKRS